MQIGPYEVLNEIGRGGMGAVYHARDPRLAREVAIKLLLKNDDLGAAQRMLREAESLAQLRHPHIVTIHAIEEFEGRQAIVMEWVQGESLQARLDRDEILSSAEASALARPLAEALSYAHGQGVLHRDVKPANVLLGDDGRVRLSDFGLAKRLDEADAERLSVSGQLLGSPGYWSPEQARGTRDLLGPHTDVWGLGATIYACLTGLAPLRGHTMAELVVAATFQPVQPPSTLVASIDPALERIVLRCLAKSPQDRYRSAAALAEELARFNAGETTAPPARWAPLLVVGAVLAAGVAGAALGVLGRGVDRVEPPAVALSPAAGESQPTGVASVASAPAAQEQAEQWVTRARAGFERGKLHLALDACEQALAAAPTLAMAHAIRGQVLSRLGRKRDGRLACEQAVALAPTSAAVHYALASVLEVSGARKEALDRLRIGLRHDPDHLPSLLARGEMLAEERRLDEARVLLERAARLDPQDALVQRSLGRLEMLAQRFEQAEVHLTRSLKAEPSYAVLVARAQVRERLRRLVEALNDLNQALQLRKDDPAAWYRRGRVRAALGDHRGAIDDYTLALRLRPEMAAALLERGASWLVRGKEPRALADAEAALRLDPKLVPAYALRAEVRMRAGQVAAAGRDLNTAQKLAPNQPLARLVRGKLYLRLRRLPASEHECDLILHDRPKHLPALALRAHVRFELRRFDDAWEDAVRFLDLAPVQEPDRARVLALKRKLEALREK